MERMRLPDVAMRASCLLGVLALGAQSLPCSRAHASTGPVTTYATVQEVIVTARRIEENLQDVSMSVQSLSARYLDDSGATRLYELQFAVPGLVVNSSGMFGGGIALRGLSEQRVGGLSVAPYLNGVYLGNSNLVIARLFDLERIEVLKGPQGALYGRNSTGGSINFITKAPQESFGSEIELSQGSFDTTRAQGYLNLPLPKAAARLSFIASEGDGYIRNSIDDRRFAEDDFWGLRGSLRVDDLENLRVNVMFQRIRDDGGSGDLWLPRPDFLVDPDDIHLTTVTLENPYLISEVENLNFNLEYDLGFANLRSFTGYARSKVRNVDDCAGMPILEGCVRSALPNEFDQWSQELQLVFPRAGPIDGIVGAYYSEADSTLAFYQLLPLVNPLPLNDFRSTSDNSAFSLFGQATAHLGDQWITTAGIRLSREKHRVVRIGTGLQDTPPLVSGKIDSDELSWRLDLSHAVSADIMIYAAVSTGYKSGGFNTSSRTDGQADSYEPEYLTAFEAGGKSQWLEKRLALNAAAFFYDFEDLQVGTTAVVGDRLVTEIDNAAEAELYGLDAELSFAVSERWTLTGGVVWLPMREFTQYQNTVTGDTLSGNELVRAPEWSAIAAIGYEQPLRDHGNLSARLEYSFRSDFFYTAENDPNFAQDSFGLLNVYVKFEAASESWYVFASGRNLMDEDYFNHVFLQSSPGYPDTYEVGVGIRF